nr:hypothetical protein [Candidatus Symbiopectobacterium sp. NZEC135]
MGVLSNSTATIDARCVFFMSQPLYTCTFCSQHHAGTT